MSFGSWCTMTRMMIAAINTALIIVLPLTLASFIAPDQWRSSAEGVLLNRLQYVLFAVCTLWLILPGSRFGRYRVAIVSGALAFGILLLLTSLASSRLDFLYVPVWLAILLFSVYCDRGAKRERRDHEVRL